MMKEKTNELASFIVVGLTLFGCYVLWRVFGDVVDREGHKLIEAVSTTLQWILWLTPIVLAATGIGILVWMLMPRIGEWTVSKASARLVDKEAKRDIIAGFGGSETLVKYGKHGEMTIYDQTNALLERVTQIGQTVNNVENLLTSMAAVIQPTASSKTGSITHNYGSHPLLPDGVAQPMPRLLDHIRPDLNVLFVGAKGTGKTTIIQWIEADRVNRGKNIILDSHAQPAKWQGTVIGIGRNYRLIKNAMVSIVGLLDKRYKFYSAGQSDFEPINTFIDEFTMLPKTLKQTLNYNVQDYSVPVLTEGRKVGINAVWGIHSDRAKMLGFEGMADLKESFDCIVYLKKVKGEYYALVDWGEGIDKDVKYQLPGPFIIQGQSEPVHNDDTPLLDEPEGDVWDYSLDETDQEPEPTEDEQAIIDAVKEAIAEDGKLVVSHVTEKLGWTATGPNYTRIRNVLEKWQIDH